MLQQVIGMRYTQNSQNTQNHSVHISFVEEGELLLIAVANFLWAKRKYKLFHNQVFALHQIGLITNILII